MKILMCRPDYYGIEYEINPWMKIKDKADHGLAVQQWETLYQTLINCGAKIELIQPIAGLPDMVFTANAGLFYHHQLILSHFKYKERQGETPYYISWFKHAGFTLANLPVDLPSQPFFEGAGDALIAGNTLFTAYGFRTELRFYQQATFFNPDQIVYCELSDPYFYHLDTCFCPLNDELAIWYPDAFNEISQKNIAAKIDLLTVTKQEAKRFACNAVVLNKHVILPANCPNLSRLLAQNGFTVYECEMSEYLKAGGACKCLTLRLDPAD